MRKKTCIFSLLFLTLALLPASLPAAPVGGKFLLSLHPGFGFFAMRDLNRLLADRHSVLLPSPPGQPAPGMSWGLDLGTSIQYGVWDYLLVGLDISYLTTDTSAKVGSSTVFPPQDLYYALRIPALELSATVRLAWPVGRMLLLTAGAGWSFLSLVNAEESLESRSSVTGTVYSSQSIPFGGRGWGSKVMAGAEFWVWEWFSLGLEAGYRWARVQPVQAGSGAGAITLRNASGGDLSADYNGPFVRYRFNFYF